VTTALTRLALGNFSNVKGVGSGVFECRIDFGPATGSISARTENVSSFYSAAAPRNASSRTSKALLTAGKIINRENRRTTMALTRDFRKPSAPASSATPSSVRSFCAKASNACSARSRNCQDYSPRLHQRHRWLSGTREHTHISSKSLMRMLGPAGNPRAENLFEVVSFLQHVKAFVFTSRLRPFRTMYSRRPKESHRDTLAEADMLGFCAHALTTRKHPTQQDMYVYLEAFLLHYRNLTAPHLSREAAHAREEPYSRNVISSQRSCAAATDDHSVVSREKRGANCV